ncbi:MAG: hypothetical protein Q7U52_04930 [Hydrogenophaga sp.]|uniref:hypothetical protein n=1 Tax=Hydrogenophaga sp. TaxID=1904254 RepID=UPI002723DBE2|nr:hypothetical protein [Hydrogenophaga sp.]MDO9146995.1 hypothetical protein [Hydrogenophaga sp.]MDO9603424.1 hypothetical protein [Hydrogenophaga sp.]
MKRQRNRITTFERRSVQLMAACTLSLAGLGNAQNAPTSPSGAGKTTLSSAAGAAHTLRSNILGPLRRQQDDLGTADHPA